MSYASDLLRVFHETFAVNVDSEEAVTIGARSTLHAEEATELLHALDDLAAAVRDEHRFDRTFREAVAEELADVMVVAYGTADLLGIDLDEAFRLKMDGNMAKLPTCPDCERGWIGGGFNMPRQACYTCGGSGYLPPIKREDGKVLKPEGWQRPSMAEAIE